MALRELTTRRNDVCAGCGAEVAAGERALWDSATKQLTCLPCGSTSSTGQLPAAESGSAQPFAAAPADGADIDHGVPGASAEREYERRRAKRIEQTRADHPLLGGLILATRSAPQHELAFRAGAVGEREVAASLEARTRESSALFLHDRRMPQGRGNIDHLAVAPSGVWVIDAKHHKAGKVRVAKPLFGQAKLLIGGRDRTKLIDGLDRQVAAVQQELMGHGEVPVAGVLCFTQAELPLLTTLEMRSHLLLYRKALAKRINAPGPLGQDEVTDLASRLAQRFLPA